MHANRDAWIIIALVALALIAALIAAGRGRRRP
jgi:hypothetical protein